MSWSGSPTIPSTASMSSCPGTVSQSPFPRPRPSLNRCPLILSGHLIHIYFDVKASFASLHQTLTFNLQPLTARDANADNMLEFFDFSTPHLATPPSLPSQPTNGNCDAGAETANS